MSNDTAKRTSASRETDDADAVVLAMADDGLDEETLEDDSAGRRWWRRRHESDEQEAEPSHRRRRRDDPEAGADGSGSDRAAGDADDDARVPHPRPELGLDAAVSRFADERYGASADVPDSIVLAATDRGLNESDDEAEPRHGRGLLRRLRHAHDEDDEPVGPVQTHPVPADLPEPEVVVSQQRVIDRATQEFEVAATAALEEQRRAERAAADRVEAERAAEERAREAERLAQERLDAERAATEAAEQARLAAEERATAEREAAE
ncbi:MAG: hypothetical protein ACK4V6_18185, partial [Microthrixaceae bacterium]